MTRRSALLAGCALAAWFMPAAGQAVTGVQTGINNSTGERPARININDLYAQAGPHWDLYVQAMDLWQHQDMDELLSYYQVLGIHGLPFQPWNGVGRVAGDRTTGYCPHGQASFITWHRPYIALFEQTLAAFAVKVARQYPVESVDNYTAAAQTFRVPYWDWAVDAHLPPAVTSPTVQYNGPAGPSTMRNPLYAYDFPNYPFTSGGGFGGQLVKYNATKRCITTSGPSAGINDADQGNAVLMGDAAYLQDKVYAVFTQSTDFGAMATMSNAGASFEEPHNAVHNDISCFSVQGRTGHMGDLNWSAFDPIFMLHHTNVDRLFAMWQAINYHRTVWTGTQDGNALFGTAAGPMGADDPLKPFAQSTNPDGTTARFHTSRTSADIKTFGYTYPEINDWALGRAELANSVVTAVNILYGPNATNVDAAARRKRTVRPTSPARTTAAPPAGCLLSEDFSIQLAVDRAQLPLPATIELYLVDVDPAVTDGKTSAYRIGATSILSMPMTGTVYSVTPLRRALAAENTASTNGTMFPTAASVVDHVLQRLRVVVRSSEGVVTSVAQIPSLEIEIQRRPFAPARGAKLPQYGSVTRYPVGPADL